jgi:ubiquitin-conjugating enzyme E2 J1
MSTRGQFNTKNPTIKRIREPLPHIPCIRRKLTMSPAVKEASELSVSPAPDYHAEPLETNLFEWHFTIRGPPAPSAYAGGIYHGRIILPPQYPLRPPSFRFLTPTGRFEVNREICLSISGHHEETWQPAWGVRTALVAIRSFMDTDAKGQLGGIECAKDARERMARDSGKWQCPGCGKSNADIMKERQHIVDEAQGEHKEDQVPEELRLAYRDELGNKDDAEQTSPVDNKDGNAATSEPKVSTSAATPAPTAPRNIPAPTQRLAAPRPTLTTQSAPLQDNDPVMLWINIAIGSIVALLLYMTLRKLQ